MFNTLYSRFGQETAERRRARRFLLSTLLMLLLTLPLMGRPAGAQITRTPQVALLTLGYSGEPEGGIISRQATDALALEMTRTGRFDLTPRTQLRQQIEALGLPTPLDSIGMQKLGQALGVDYVGFGVVTRASIEGNPRRARATVVVLLMDANSGELANGAAATGYASLSPGSSSAQAEQDALLRALSNAAFSAVRTMNNYTLPQATVLITRDGESVRLNRGGRDGVEVGQEFVVFRGNERVGRIRVTSVGSQDSVAAVTDPGKGIGPEDQARAIFTLPGFRIVRP